MGIDLGAFGTIIGVVFLPFKLLYDLVFFSLDVLTFDILQLDPYLPIKFGMISLLGWL